jgi:hypothetical protein
MCAPLDPPGSALARRLALAQTSLNLYDEETVRSMATAYENILRNVESLSRTEQLRLISELAEYLRIHAALETQTSILELQGMGKAIWQTIDAQEYVDRERASWNG